jgi:hypothetical protein
MAFDDLTNGTPADPSAWTRRLADQLRSLSQMSETLTYRLLELEERLAAQELRMAPLLEQRAGVDGALAEDMDLRMGETEDRLARIEAVLNGLDRSAASRHLQPIRRPVEPFRTASLPRDGCQEGMEDDLVEPQDPFLEEGEQPFMDELPA